MSVLIKNMEMPKGCIYANDNDQTEYCPLLNHDDVPFCQYIESEPEIAIGIDERPVYCPLSDVPEPCENTVSRQAAIDYCYALINAENPSDPSDEWNYSQERINQTEVILHHLEFMPSAQPEQRWIPCSERMPEEHEWIGTKQFGTTISDEVYVTFENPKGERFCEHLSFQNGKLSAYDKSTIDAFYKGSKPIAWMPLPEPYAERRTE